MGREFFLSLSIHTATSSLSRGLQLTSPSEGRRTYLVSSRQWLVVLVVLRLNVPVNNFSVMSGRSHRFLGNQYFRGVKCLAQGHNTAAVGFEPRTSRSGVRHSTTEPPRSPIPAMAQRKARSDDKMFPHMPRGSNPEPLATEASAH